MLTQLATLSLQTDGRYATDEELSFFTGYFKTLNLRLSTYDKIRSTSDEIISEVEAKMRAMDPSLFINAAGDFTQTWKKDIVQLLRYAVAALLFNEQDHLREGLLLWHTTIAKSYQFDRTCKTTFTVMPEVIKEYLTPEEAALFCPLLDLNRIILG